MTGASHSLTGRRRTPRADTAVDEVAHRKFDTPSKVIAGIEELIRTRSREARVLHDAVLAKTRSIIAAAGTATQQARQEVERAARSTVVHARADSASHLNSIRLRSVSSLHQARAQSRKVFESLRTYARSQVGQAGQVVPGLLSTISTGAVASIGKARQRVDSQLPYVLERADGLTRATRHRVESTMLDNSDRALRNVSLASDRSQLLFREIAGQGPQKTLGRGFACRTSGPANKTRLSALLELNTTHQPCHEIGSQNPQARLSRKPLVSCWRCDGSPYAREPAAG